MFSITLSLLLANESILLCFSFFFSLFYELFGNSIIKDKTKRRLSLTVATGVPVTVANGAIETPPVVADKISKVCST